MTPDRHTRVQEKVAQSGPTERRLIDPLALAQEAARAARWEEAIAYALIAIAERLDEHDAEILDATADGPTPEAHP